MERQRDLFAWDVIRSTIKRTRKGNAGETQKLKRR